MKGTRLWRIRYFFLSFSAAFFVLSLLFLFLMVTVHPKTPKSLRMATAVPEEDAYSPLAEDAMTVLVFGTQSPDAVAGTYILVRFDPVAGGVSVATLPPQTVMSHRGRQETLEDAYRYGGARYTREALSTYLGVPIHRYARISVDRFITAAGAVGSVELDLDRDITLTDGEFVLTLNAGPQLLDGRKVAEIIRHQGFEGGELERCAMASRLACAIIDQRIDVINSTLADKVFSTVVNLMDTDISYTDYEQRKAAAIRIAESGGEIARAVKVDGDFSEDNASLHLYDTTLALIAQAFLQ